MSKVIATAPTNLAAEAAAVPLRAAGDLPYAWLIEAEPVEQLETVDALPPGELLSAAEVAGLRRAMGSSRLISVARNNIANRLLAISEGAGELWRDFLAMYDNRQEDPVWRDYSVQFLAESLPLAADPEAAAAALVAIAREDRGSIGATALIQVARLAGDGHLALPADFPAQLRARLDDPTTSAVVRHSVFALAGQEGVAELLPQVRSALRAEGEADEVRRGALYALGRLGGPADRGLAECFLAHGNPAVVLAARAATARLARGDG